MKPDRLIITSAVIFVFALVWNGIVHLVILREANAALGTVGRPEAERPLWLALAATAAIAVLFVAGYGRCARLGTTAEGIAYGAFFAALAGVLVDLNQYIMYPVPGSLVALWFTFGFLEFCIYGVIASKLYPVSGDA